MSPDLHDAAPPLGLRDPQVIAFVLGSAAAYVGAMGLMKLWDALPLAAAAAGLALCVAAAVWLEILALREARLGIVYATILGAEAVMMAFLSRYGFGETFTPREIAGIALILSGTALSAS